MEVSAYHRLIFGMLLCVRVFCLLLGVRTIGGAGRAKKTQSEPQRNPEEWAFQIICTVLDMHGSAVRVFL